MQEATCKAFVILKTADDSGLVYSGKGRGGEKQLDSGYILKLLLTEFPDGLDVWFQRGGSAKDHSRVFGLNNWKTKVELLLTKRKEILGDEIMR